MYRQSSLLTYDIKSISYRESDRVVNTLDTPFQSDDTRTFDENRKKQ